MRDAEHIAIDPHRGERGAHAALLRMLFRGFENIAIGEMDRADQSFCVLRKAGWWIAVERCGGVCLRLPTMLYDRFHRQGAGKFSPWFSPPSIRRGNKSVSRD